MQHIYFLFVTTFYLKVLEVDRFNLFSLFNSSIKFMNNYNKIKSLKALIFHDYINQFGGAEYVLSVIQEIIDGPILTMFYKTSCVEKVCPNRELRVSWIQKYYNPRIHPIFIPMIPFALNSLKRNDSNLWISSSHAFIKNVPKLPDVLHICYCHTPARYVWDIRNEYLQGRSILVKKILNIIWDRLAKWDFTTSKNVDYFIANSNAVKERIFKFLGRSAIVIHPPVDIHSYKHSDKKNNYYVVLSRLVEYKRIDLAIRAALLTKRQLIIVGDGRDRGRLECIANDSHLINFAGYVDQKLKVKILKNAKALLFPQIEDFGISAVEAQACGTPVIGYNQGGILDTVIENITGIFFNNQSAEDMANAILNFEKLNFSSHACRKNAEKFSKELFINKFKNFVQEKYDEYFK